MSNLICSRDDGNKVIMVKGRSNEQGNYLKISKILRNGKDFLVFIPGGEGASGWVNMAYVLRWFFGGEMPPIIPRSNRNDQNFLPLLQKAKLGLPNSTSIGDNLLNIEVLHRE